VPTIFDVTDGQVKDGTAARQAWDRHANKVIAGLAVLLFGLGTVVYRLTEGWEWVDSFYFSTIALTTVGFGDFTPSTTASKLFTVFYVISGIALITTYLNQLGKRFAFRAAKRTVNPKDDA